MVKVKVTGNESAIGYSDTILNESEVRELHFEMFGEVQEDLSLIIDLDQDPDRSYDII